MRSVSIASLANIPEKELTGQDKGASSAIERLIAPIKTSNWQFLD